MDRRLIISALLILVALSALGEELVIGVGVPDGSPLFGYWNNLFREIEKRSDGTLEIEARSMSLARARRSLLDGTTDADAGRTVYVYEDEEGIVMLEPPLFTNRYFVYAREGLDIRNTEGIRRYRLATIRGNVILTRFADNNNLNTLYVNDYDEAMRMILYDRVDCFIATDLESPMLEEEEFRDRGLVMYPDEILQVGVYLFLSVEKTHLVPVIESILTELDGEGKLKAILRGKG